MPENLEGIVFFWGALLWPVLVSVIYIAWRHRTISSKGNLIGVSVLVGYFAMWFGIFIGDLISGINPWVFAFLLPVVSTHFITKRSAN